MKRKGLTLIEMLVALALTIFMMAILSEAFVTGLKAFRRLKAVGDMDQQLRTCATILRRDLSADHFEGNRRLSSYRLNQQFQDGLFDRPSMGYFSIREGASATGVTSIVEGADSLQRPSAIDIGNFDTCDVLAFTVRQAGNRPEAFFYGACPLRSAPLAVAPPVPPQPPDNLGMIGSRFDNLQDGRFASQWIEAIYFLEADTLPSGAPRLAYDEGTNTTTPVYKLYRVQLLLVPESVTLPGPEAAASGEAYRQVETYAAWDDGSVITVIEDNVPFNNYYSGRAGTPQEYRHDISAWAEQQGAGGNFRYRYNSPADVQFRERRFGGFAGNYRRLGVQSATPANNVLREGADLLAVNVISWDVKVYDPYAIKGTAILGSTTPQVVYVPEFVDLGHNRTGTANLPMPLTDGIYNYSWNTDPEAPNATPPTHAPLFRTNGNNPLLPRTFDTWTNRHFASSVSGESWNYLDGSARRTLPYPGPVQAVQIRIRVWDEVTRQTREITIVQDL